MGALRSSVRLVFWLLRPEQLLAGRVPVCADLVSTTSASWAAAAPGFDVAVCPHKMPLVSTTRLPKDGCAVLLRPPVAHTHGAPEADPGGSEPRHASAAWNLAEQRISRCAGGRAARVQSGMRSSTFSLCPAAEARPPARPRASKSAAPCLPRRTVRRAGRSRDSDLPRCGRAGHPDCGRVLRG